LSTAPIRVLRFPAGWEHVVPPASTLLDGTGSPLVLFAIAAALLALALFLARTRPVLSIGLAAGASFLLGIAANGLVDDAFIQFRYAANLAAGIGPVFNAGERIEGASGGLWIGILGGFGALSGWDVASFGRFLSLLLAPLATLAAAGAGAAAAGAEAGAVAAVLWAALPTAALYAATGLETTAYALALLAFAWAALRGCSTAAVLSGFAIATLRPEGLLLGLMALPFARRLPRAGRSGLASLLVAAGVIALARLLFYGLPFPRSALVKGVTAASTLPLGLRYLGGAAREWLPLLAVVPALARRRASLLPAFAAALGWAALTTLRGGDWMPGSRYLLPLVVLLVLGLAALVPYRRIAAAVALAWSLLQLTPDEEPSRSPVGRLYREMVELRVQSRWWESVGSWLARAVPPSTRLACGPSGALPYASRLTTFDMFGLCSRVTFERDGPPGHRLWGLKDAAASGAAVIYPGEPIPQTHDLAVVSRAAAEHVRTVPGFENDYEPVGLVHTPEYHVDILSDVIWVRRGSGLLGTR
jgi:arabinofuranosyltransferase